MAGEWLALDLGLPDKPEVQELIDLTGEPVEVVVFRLFKLWGWASMHCADGTARMTLPRLVRTCGANETFWRAVASVGWLEIDETVATVAVPGWDRRFSQAAKSRIQARDREKAYDERSGRPSQRERGRSPAPARGDEPAPARGRGEEIRGEYPPPPPPPADAWGTLRAAWNRGTGRPWKPADPPEGLGDRLAEAGWLDEALDAIPRLSACRFFKTPPTLLQFVKPGFVRRVMGGQYDDAQASKVARGQPSDVPIRVWSGDDAARLEATKRAMASKIRENA